MAKYIWALFSAGVFWLGFAFITEGVEMTKRPDLEPARLVECYESFDEYGAVYNCDFFVYSQNEYTTKSYQRQAWNQMKPGIGTDYMLDVNGKNAGIAFVVGALILLFACYFAWAAWSCWEDERLLRRDW